MSKKRKQYSASFKSKIALQPSKGRDHIRYAARFQIHPTLVSIASSVA